MRPYFLVFSFFISVLLLAGNPAIAVPVLAPKQLVIVKPGTDRLHGSWIAAVINREGDPGSLRIPVLLPKEAQDFQPVEGLAPSDVKIESDGVYVEKVFPPGVSVISFFFLAPAKRGVSELNFEARSDLGEFSIMTPRGLLSVHGENLRSSGTDVQDLQTFDIWTASDPVIQGKKIQVTVEGVPEGRQRLWIIGISFGLTLLLASVFLTWRSHRLSREAVNFAKV